MGDIEPLVEMQAKHEMEIQASAFLGTSPIRQYTEGWTMEKLVSTMEKAVSYAVENDVPVMFVSRHNLFKPRRCEDDLSPSHGTRRAPPLHLRHVRASHPTVSRNSLPSSMKKSSKMQVISRNRGQLARSPRPWIGCRQQHRAVEAGADVIHGTALGVGERAGNAPSTNWSISNSWALLKTI